MSVTETFEKLSLSAFDAAQPGDPVYQPEYSDGDPPMTKQEFIDLAEGDLAVARELFAACEWQHPATLIDEEGGLDFFRPDGDVAFGDECFGSVPNAFFSKRPPQPGEPSHQVDHILHGRYDGGMFLAIYGADGLPIYKDNQQDKSRIADIVGKEVAGKIARDEGARVDGSPANYRMLSGQDLAGLVLKLHDDLDIAGNSPVEDVDRHMAEAQARQSVAFKQRTDAISLHAKALSRFIATPQLKVMLGLVGGEEGEFFAGKLDELHKLVESMPKTYEQDELGDDAVVHLHYFKGGMNWYITERDKENEQLQAFGLADLYGDGGEIGYISIEELKSVGAELDLHWTPKTLREIRKPKSAPRP